MSSEKVINTTLRLPKSLRELVIISANNSKRGMNTELVTRLDYAIKKDLYSPVEFQVEEEIIKTKLRLTPPLHEKLTTLAKASTFKEHGLNDEVMRRLKGTFDAGPDTQEELMAIRQEVVVEDIERPNQGMPWSDEDIQFLRDNIKSMSYPKMGKHLGRTPMAIRSQARFMGVRKRTVAVWHGQDRWSAADDDFLKNNIKVLSYDAIAKSVNRTLEAVRKRARFLGVGKQLRAKDKNTYMANEAFIKANYLTMTHQEMADALGIDKWDVSRICTRRRFIKEGQWTDEEDQLFMSLLATGMQYKQIATHFPERTESAVCQRGRILRKALAKTAPTTP